MNVRRGLLHDLFVDGNECAVYVGDQVVVLSPIATTVVVLLGRHWTPLVDVVHEVEAAYGSPPGGSIAEAVGRVLAELRSAHIVELYEFGL